MFYFVGLFCDFCVRVVVPLILSNGAFNLSWEVLPTILDSLWYFDSFLSTGINWISRQPILFANESNHDDWASKLSVPREETLDSNFQLLLDNLRENATADTTADTFEQLHIKSSFLVSNRLKLLLCQFILLVFVCDNFKDKWNSNGQLFNV